MSRNLDQLSWKRLHRVKNRLYLRENQTDMKLCPNDILKKSVTWKPWGGLIICMVNRIKNRVGTQNTSPLPIMLFRWKKYRLVSVYESFLIFHFSTSIEAVTWNSADLSVATRCRHFEKKYLEYFSLGFTLEGYLDLPRTDQWLSVTEE